VSVAVSAVFLALVLALPPLREPFDVAPLGADELGIAAGLALLPAALAELAKATLGRRRPRSPAPDSARSPM
jgi:hypothetical protein